MITIKIKIEETDHNEEKVMKTQTTDQMGNAGIVSAGGGLSGRRSA